MVIHNTNYMDEVTDPRAYEDEPTPEDAEALRLKQFLEKICGFEYLNLPLVFFKDVVTFIMGEGLYIPEPTDYEEMTDE